MKNKEYKAKIEQLEKAKDTYRKKYYEAERKMIFMINYLKEQGFDVEAMHRYVAKKEQEIDIE